MSDIIISHINPLNFVDVDPTEIPQYMSKAMDAYLFQERLNDWQGGASFVQPWRKDDTISLQFQNNAGQIQIDIIDCSQRVYLTFLMIQKQQNFYAPTYFIYESNSTMGVLADGIYFYKATIGSNPDKILISEPLDVRNDHTNTKLIEYSNPTFYENIIFETGITMSIRIPAILRKKPTAFKDTIYEDQVLDAVMVKSRPYRLWELLIGAPIQIPDWFEDKIGRILGCQTLKIDGTLFTKSIEAKMEEADNAWNGALKGFKIELRERLNRDSKIFSTTQNTNEELTLVLNVSSKGFADTSTDASSNILQVFDVE